jgi:hypothetical protein
MMTTFDIEHVLFWMDAIRNSKNPQRTLESFWKGQIRSKVWLIDNLRKHVNQVVSIDIHGGWNGVLASMLFQSDVFVTNIRNIDIDPECEQVANTVNKIEEMVGKFKHITADMCCIRSDADVIINTSCEHITQEQYDLWLSGMPQNSLLVLQSNNYIIDEHVRPHANLEEFVNTCGLEKILFSGELVLPLYTRYMIIGKK